MPNAVQRVLTGAAVLAGLLPGIAFAQQPQPAAQGVPAATASSGFTRSLIGATGRMLKPGEVTLTGVGVVFPLVQVGVTRWFEVGGGAWPGAAYWVTPKFLVHDGPRTQVAAGLVQAFVSVDSESEQVGIAYVVATRALDNGALTYGGGVGYGHNSDGDAGAAPMFQIGWERRLSERWWFLTDNYLFGPAGIASFGFRVQGKHASADFAVPVLVSTDAVMPAFLVNIGLRFGG